MFEVLVEGTTKDEGLLKKSSEAQGLLFALGTVGFGKLLLLLLSTTALAINGDEEGANLELSSQSNKLNNRLLIDWELLTDD